MSLEVFGLVVNNKALGLDAKGPVVFADYSPSSSLDIKFQWAFKDGYIVNQADHKYVLDVADEKAVVNNPVVLWDNKGNQSTNQQWVAHDDTYETKLKSGLFLGIHDNRLVVSDVKPPAKFVRVSPQAASVVSADPIASAKDQFNLVGSAGITAANFFRLTPNVDNLSGQAWLKNIVNFKNGFTVTFGFKMFAGTYGGADGLAFVIHRDPRGNQVVGGVGSHVGFGGITRVVAIKYDTNRYNACEPSANYVAVCTAGMGSVSYESAAHMVKAVNAPIPLRNEATGVKTTIHYDATAHVLEVSLNGQSLLKADINIAEKIGVQNDTSAWFGFTAATGGANQIHEITSIDLKLY